MGRGRWRLECQCALLGSRPVRLFGCRIPRKYALRHWRWCVREGERLTCISLSTAPIYTCDPSALHATAVAGHPTSKVATGLFPPSSPASQIFTVPSSLAVASNSVPAPPATVRSSALIIPLCARTFRTRSPVARSVVVRVESAETV